MTSTTPMIPQSPIERLRWAVTDSWVLARRDLTYLWHTPEEIIGGLLFPAVSVMLFGYVFGSARCCKPPSICPC